MTSSKRLIAVATVAVGLLARPAHGQLVVNDPLNTAQAIALVQKTISEYQTLVQQYQTIVRMSQSLQNIARYKTVPIAFSSHDPSRFRYGAPWLTALNSGDARGDLYAQIARSLQRPDAAALARLPPDARRAIEDAYATIEITDSIAQRGAHQVALVRGYGGSLQSVVQLLENDILTPASSFHQLTAILDKVAAGELVGRRQDTASNQLLRSEEHTSELHSTLFPYTTFFRSRHPDSRQLVPPTDGDPRQGRRRQARGPAPRHRLESTT